MGLISWIKKKFFKEEEVGIINIGDIISIPGREFYKDDETKIRLIDNYKEKYLEVLSLKKVITTLELDSTNLKEDMVMVVDLLLHSLIDIDNLINLTPEELLIKENKLKLYYEQINNMQIEALTRLIALKELQKGRQVPRRNRMCLNEEINLLTASLVIFLRQQSAIITEIKSYLTMININNSTIDLKLLKLKYNKLIFISQGIINDDELEKFSSIEEKIAYIEIGLEKYAYRNKKEISILNSKLDELVNTIKNKDNKKELLEVITNLEQKYLLFYLYGINLINEEDIRRMYNVKFDIFVCDIDYLRKSPIEKTDYGFEYYKEIVFRKIEKIILGKNIFFNQKFKGKEEKALSTFKYHYKYNDKYNFEFILESKYMLNLLVSFDKENGFDEMLLNNMLQTGMREEDKTYFEKYLDIPGIVWEDNVPLVSVLQLIYSYCPHPLCELFKISDYDKKMLPEGLILPEGIKEIYGDLLPDAVVKQLKYTNRRCIGCSNLMFPSSLKIIKGQERRCSVETHLNFIEGFNNIILNYGLETLGRNVFFGLNAKTITIPSSLSLVEYGAFIKCDFKIVVFDDYKNSNILNDRRRFEEFLDEFFKWRETGNFRRKKYDHSGEKYIFTTDENYIMSVCNTLDDLSFWEEEVEVSSSLKYIILREGKKEIKIDLKEMPKIVDFRMYSWFVDDLCEDVYKLVKNFREIIMKKTGHDIYEEKQANVRKRELN